MVAATVLVAADFIVDWGRERLGEHRVIAAGHHVGHGGREFDRPVLVDADVLME